MRINLIFEFWVFWYFFVTLLLLLRVKDRQITKRFDDKRKVEYLQRLIQMCASNAAGKNKPYWPY